MGRMTERLFVVQRDNRLVSFEEVDGEWRGNHPSAAEGLWPAPRPGTDEAVVSRASSSTALMLSEGLADVPGSETSPPLMLGPRLPHYALWSVDGRKLCYVVPDGRSLLLKTWEAGTSASMMHLSGAPLFPAWQPAGDWLGVHHGSTLSAFNTATGEQRTVSDTASGFRTPAFRPTDGALAWAEVEAGAVQVRVGSLDGPHRTVASLGGGVAMAFRPGTAELTAAVARAPEGGVFSEVIIVDTSAEDPRPSRLVSGPIVAYWWAPDGQKFVALHPSYSGDGRFQIRLYAADGHALGAMEPIIPSSDSATMIGFFDQYAISHPCWSADSRWFGLCGKFMSEGPATAFTGIGGDSAWVWDTESRKAPVSAGGGQFLAFRRA